MVAADEDSIASSQRSFKRCGVRNWVRIDEDVLDVVLVRHLDDKIL